MSPLLPVPSLPLATTMTWIEPLWIVGVGAAAALALLWLTNLLLRFALPKVGAIALTTGKEAMAQPLFYVILLIGICALLAFPFIPYNTFGEDIKVVKDSGLTVIMVLSIILALWTASVSISEEIEGRTAITLLSKPIARWQFIIGKFLGIVGAVAILFIVLGALFLSTVSYKLVFEAHESTIDPPTAAMCQAEMLQIAPGLLLAFFEAVVLTSISVAIATRLPMLANLVICSTIYVLGHLVAQLAQSGAVESGPGRALVQFMGLLIGTVLPNLDNFNIYAAVTAGQDVPLVYVGAAAVYCALYSTAVLLVGLFLFHDRDLA